MTEEEQLIEMLSWLDEDEVVRFNAYQRKNSQTFTREITSGLSAAAIRELLGDTRDVVIPMAPPTVLGCFKSSDGEWFGP